MMTLPAALFGLTIAILIGALFHTLRGGGGWRLLLYMGWSAAGFALGQWAGIARGWRLFPFGMLDIGLGLVGSILFLALGDWLSRPGAGKN
jgi:hypothetical protein